MAMRRKSHSIPKGSENDSTIPRFINPFGGVLGFVRPLRFTMHRFTIGLMAVILLLLALAALPLFAEMKGQTLMAVNVSMALVVLVVGLILIRRTNHRLARVASVATALEAGELGARSQVKGSDAIGMLARAFNSMADKIQATILELEAHQRHLTESQKLLAERNTRLEEEFRRQGTFSDYLLSLHSVDLKAIAERSLHSMLEASDMQLGVCYLWDEASSALVPFAAEGLDPEAATRLREVSSARGMPQQVFERGEWQVIKDMDGDSLPGIRLGFAEARIRCVLGIPVLFREKPLGVLVLAAVRSVDDPTRKMLEGMVGALGNALNNALTYRTVQEQAERLEEANRELTALDRLRAEFVANMNHELRTPLNAIIGFSGLLLKNREGTLSAADLGYAEKINRNGKHLLRLIDDILDLSKIDAGRMGVVVGSANVRELLDEVMELFKPQADEKGLNLRCHVAETVSILQTDADKLRRVLINLVGNAVKFTQEGEVAVTVNCPEPGRAVFEVRDTGIGIPQDKATAVFQPFRQMDSSITRQYGGTGLGLTISKALVELLGGRITLESFPGRGSTFRVILPVDRQESDQSEARSAQRS